MQSKIILVTTALLIVLPAVFFFFSDFTHLSVGKRLLASAFQAVTTRTAGFNTMDISKMTEVSKAMIIILYACRRFTKFYSRRYEDNNFCSTYIECICYIPKSGKCRNIWKKNRIQRDKKCINDCYDVLCYFYVEELRSVYMKGFRF